MGSIGFGLERIGLLAVRWPGRAALFLVLLSALASIGLPRLEIDSDIRNAFRSDTEEYKVFRQASRAFPAGDQDILVVLSGETLGRPDGIEALRRLHQELQLADGVRDVVSLLSVRTPNGDREGARPIIPGTLPKGAAFDALMDAVTGHPLVRNRLLSADRRTALLVVRLEQHYPRIEELTPVVSGLQAVAARSLEETGLDIQLTGIPVLRTVVTAALYRDQVIFNFFGGLLGLGICWLFFGSWRFTVIAAVPPLFAVFWALGGMALLGHKITFVTNVVPVLVMVIAFSDSMHLTSNARRRLADGAAIPVALEKALKDVGPACVLTSLTTSIALFSLILADSDYISEFGLTAGLSILSAFFAVIVVTPVLFRFVAGRPASAQNGRRAFGDGLATRMSTVAASVASRHSRSISIVGVVSLFLAGALYFQSQPHYQFRENLPRDNAAYEALDRIDRELGGTNEIQFLVTWDDDVALANVIRAINETHRTLAQDPATKTVWSAALFSSYLGSGSGSAPASVALRLAELPEDMVGRFILPHRRLALVSAYVGSQSPGQMQILVDRLRKGLPDLNKTAPGVTVAVTGLPVIAAQFGYNTIAEMRWTLLAAIGLIIALVGFAFGSSRYALVSLAPNLFPILLTGAILFLTGTGLQFTSLLALTVAFGIAVDDTIHVLNAVRLQQQAGLEETDAISAAIAVVGPVVIATTAVLVAGLGLVFLSEMPTIRLFGLLSILVLLSALVADLLFLPAIMWATGGLRKPGTRNETG